MRSQVKRDNLKQCYMNIRNSDRMYIMEIFGYAHKFQTYNSVLLYHCTCLLSKCMECAKKRAAFLAYLAYFDLPAVVLVLF